MSKMSLKTEGDVTIVVTRRFNAPPEAVYRAHTEPALVQTWMLGPEGWTMPVCQIDLRAGGKIRYEWSNGNGRGFYLTGELVELTPFSRIVHIERMRDGVRRIQNVAEIAGMEGEIITMRELFTYDFRGERRDGRIEGEFRSTRMRPDFLSRAARIGLDRELLELVGVAGGAA